MATKKRQTKVVKKTTATKKVATKKVSAKKAVSSVKAARKKVAAPKTSAKKAQAKETKIGVFGGSFNPFHMGHLNSLETVRKKMKLDRIYVVLANQNPLKALSVGPEVHLRFEMLNRALAPHSAWAIADDREVKRGGVSFTIDTLKEIEKENPQAELYLIIGMDLFQGLDRWKNPDEIIEVSNLIVTTRPGSGTPRQTSDFPLLLQRTMKKPSFEKSALTTGKMVHFVELNDLDISASDLRKKIRHGHSIEDEVPAEVGEFIMEKELYRGQEGRITDFESFARRCGEILFEKKAINVKAFDLRNMNQPAEYTLIASGTSSRHATSLGEQLVKTIKDELGVQPLSIEGVSEGRWVLVDYGSLIIHLFYDFVRQEYKLEQLWSKGRDLGLKDPFPSSGSTTGMTPNVQNFKY